MHTSLILSQWENSNNYVKYNLIALSRVPAVHLLLDIGIPAHYKHIINIELPSVSQGKHQ